MPDFGWFFLYTPVPWLALMYVVAYRHDLSRVARPLRDHCGLSTWWSVCAYLRLVPSEAPEPAKRLWRSGSFLALVAAALTSLLWLAPVLSWVWYYLALLQITSAVILFLALVDRIGRLPPKPYSDTIPYPRVGSRIRHLQRKSATETTSSGASAGPSPAQPTSGAEA